MLRQFASSSTIAVLVELALFNRVLVKGNRMCNFVPLTIRRQLPAVFAFAVLTFNLAVADDAPSRSGESPADPSKAILQGVIRNEDDGPLIGVRVRVAVPAFDQRLVAQEFNGTVYETKTVKNGEFRIEFPALKEKTMISVDAMKPGYRRISGTFIRGGDKATFEIGPGQTLEKSFTLRPALYFSAVVVDEQGKPIPDAQVFANADTQLITNGVERTATNSDGLFQLFNYPAEPFKVQNDSTRAAVTVSHPDYFTHYIPNLYTIPESDRRQIPIVLRAGHRASGTVVDAAGKPVPKVLIIARGQERKAMFTDENGKFDFKSIGQKSTLNILVPEIEQRLSFPLILDEDKLDLILRLEPIKLTQKPKTYTVLGMKLIDATPEIAEAYNLHNLGGAMIVDPGTDFDRLDIGKIEKGLSFWRVGNTNVATVKDFVTQILKEAGDQGLDEYSVRVIYNVRTIDFEGTSGQRLKLTKKDIGQLKAMLAEFDDE